MLPRSFKKRFFHFKKERENIIKQRGNLTEEQEKAKDWAEQKQQKKERTEIIDKQIKKNFKVNFNNSELFNLGSISFMIEYLIDRIPHPEKETGLFLDLLANYETSMHFHNPSFPSTEINTIELNKLLKKLQEKIDLFYVIEAQYREAKSFKVVESMQRRVTALQEKIESELKRRKSIQVNGDFFNNLRKFYRFFLVRLIGSETELYKIDYTFEKFWNEIYNKMEDWKKEVK